MLTETDLDALMQAAMKDPRKDIDFLRALLEANLHVLVPLSDDHPRLRLIMFQRPDGMHFVPCFTHEWQAEEARGNSTRRVTMSGRLLLEATRGAMLIVNPNHESCTIFPEEVDQLLATGRVGLVTSERITEDRPMLIGMPRDPPVWLISGLNPHYAKLPFIAAAYLLESARPETPDTRTWLIYLIVEPPYEDCAVHATSAALQESWADRQDWPVDIVTLAPGRQVEMLEGALQFYERDPSLKNTDIAPGIPQRAPRSFRSKTLSGKR
jgi:hypothetical protein